MVHHVTFALFSGLGLTLSDAVNVFLRGKSCRNSPYIITGSIVEAIGNIHSLESALFGYKAGTGNGDTIPNAYAADY